MTGRLRYWLARDWSTVLLLWRAIGLSRLGRWDIERSRLCERWAVEHMVRAEARFEAARALTAHLDRHDVA